MWTRFQDFGTSIPSNPDISSHQTPKPQPSLFAIFQAKDNTQISSYDCLLSSSKSLLPLEVPTERGNMDWDLEDLRAPIFTKFPELPKEIRLMIWEASLPSGRIVEILQRPLHMRVGEWNWPGAPENPSEQDRVDYLTEEMPADHGHAGRTRTRIQRILGYFSLEEVDITVPEGYHFESSSDGDFYIENNLDFPMPGIMSPCLPPSVLFVCRESYEIASNVYKKMFATHAGFAETYFAPERDTLYLKYDMFSYVTLRVFHNALCPLDSITDVDSLKSVETLAILADPDCGTLDYHLDGRRSNFTDFVDDFLSIFRNLKDLIVVLKHYDGLRDDRADGEPFHFMDPTNMEKLIDNYEDFLSKSDRPSEKIPEAQLLDQSRVKINLQELELRRSVLVINDQEPWKIPRVHYKVSATSSFKEHLDALRRDCESIIE